MPPDSTNEQHALIARMVEGDASALEAFYVAHQQQAWGVAFRLLRNQAEAEEVVQEAFLEVWRSATRYDQRRAEPRAWLMAIVRSRSLDRLRQSAVRERTQAQQVSFFEEVATPERLHETAESERRVRAALKQLPPEQQEVLALAYTNGLSQAEIADVTGLPLGTVKTRARLALRKLAGLL